MSELNKALSELAKSSSSAAKIELLDVKSKAPSKAGRISKVALAMALVLGVAASGGYWLLSSDHAVIAAQVASNPDVTPSVDVGTEMPKKTVESPTTKVLEVAPIAMPIESVEPAIVSVSTPEEATLSAENSLNVPAQHDMSATLATELPKTDSALSLSVPAVSQSEPVQPDSAQNDELTVAAENTQQNVSSPSAERQTAATVATKAAPAKAVNPPTMARASVEPKQEQKADTAGGIAPGETTPNETQSQTPSQSPAVLKANQMVVEQVSLTPKQLADKAIQRAEKAMDANNLADAIQGFEEALRYQPDAVMVRQKLAALYFGRSNTRKAYEILQQGIDLDPNSETLRLALAKLLVKADQPQVALSPLVYLMDNPSKEYLAMRAALAQRGGQNSMATESYQRLTKMEPGNARWWLGLAIQQDRAQEYPLAIESYQSALGKVGLSNQSQKFVHERLTILNKAEAQQ